MTEKVLLLLNNVPSPNEENLKSSDGLIEAIFLLSNWPLLEPMDQNINIIQMVKSSYKKKLLFNIITKNGNIKLCFKELNLKDVFFRFLKTVSLLI